MGEGGKKRDLTRERGDAMIAERLFARGELFRVKRHRVQAGNRDLEN